jgi:hypothetical protein
MFQNTPSLSLSLSNRDGPIRHILTIGVTKFGAMRWISNVRKCRIQNMTCRAKLILFPSFRTLYPYHSHNYHTVPSTGILKIPEENRNAATEIFCKSKAAVEIYVAIVSTHLKRNFAYLCLKLISHKGLYCMKYLWIKLFFVVSYDRTFTLKFRALNGDAMSR